MEASLHRDLKVMESTEA